MTYLPLEPRPSASAVPLTATQRFYWHSLLNQRKTRSPFRNVAASLRLLGPLDIASLELSIQAVMDRHESLRTRIEHFNAEEQPTQTIDPSRCFHLDVTDLTKSACGKGEEVARQLGLEFLSEEIDLREGPVFDARLFKLSACDHILIIALDHIVSDATSYPLLTREVISSLRNGVESSRKLRIQFPDFAVWHHRTDQAWRRDHEQYWVNRLSQLTKLAVPIDHSCEGDSPAASDIIYFPFGKRLSAELAATARRERCLMPLVLLSLYAVIICRWWGRNDVLIRFLSHGRYGHPELKDMIGCIAHPLFLRIEVGATDQLPDIIRRVTAELHSSLAHDASRLLVIDEPTEVYFNWLPTGWGLSGTFASAIRLPEDGHNYLKIRRFPITKPAFSKFGVTITDSPSGVIAGIWYSDHLFPRATIERLGAQLRQLVERFARNPNMATAVLDLQIRPNN